jgi:hypothetical protein
MNGYVYHTRYDNLHAVSTGTLQHTGDNLLALTKRIASSDILSNVQEYAGGRTVYFDVLGLFMVSYSETAGFILNVFTAILSVYTVAKNIHTIRSGNTVTYGYSDIKNCCLLLYYIIILVGLLFISLLFVITFLIIVIIIIEDDFSGMWLSIIWGKFSDISELLAVSIIRMMSKLHAWNWFQIPVIGTLLLAGTLIKIIVTRSEYSSEN